MKTNCRIRKMILFVAVIMVCVFYSNINAVADVASDATTENTNATTTETTETVTSTDTTETTETTESTEKEIKNGWSKNKTYYYVDDKAVTGIQKIKLSGAEKRAYARWAKLYAEQISMTYNPPLFLKVSPVIEMAISLIGLMVIYYLAIKNGVGISQYYAFASAYGIVTVAFSEISEIAMVFSQVRPVMEMIHPIMETEPEISAEKPFISPFQPFAGALVTYSASPRSRRRKAPSGSCAAANARRSVI